MKQVTGRQLREGRSVVVEVGGQGAEFSPNDTDHYIVYHCPAQMRHCVRAHAGRAADSPMRRSHRGSGLAIREASLEPGQSNVLALTMT